MAPRILLIDDDPLIRNVVSVSLRAEQYDVITAEHGKQALSMVQDYEPDLILLDIMMPGIDGFQVLRELRRMDTGMRAPVIMLTAKHQILDKEKGFGLGADDYITKPFNIAELKLRVHAMIRRDRVSSEHARYIPDQRITLPLAFHHQKSGVFQRSYQISKRIFDIVASSIALILLIPLFLIIAIAIRIDSPGPIFFGHKRVGIDGHPLIIYKFRTMVENALELKGKYEHLNEMNWPAFKIPDDPRLTRLGKFLRRTSLDELPQLVNVIKGEMSLVGPRPHSWGLDTYKLWQTERLEVRPGITGMWQISGRNEMTDFGDWVELDIEYIERQSWRLDLLILISTVSAIISGRGAH
jgi:lipopolysaccharide/colanic/teichoic acid biosynthesis glycosyltransferase